MFCLPKYLSYGWLLSLVRGLHWKHCFTSFEIFIQFIYLLGIYYQNFNLTRYVLFHFYSTIPTLFGFFILWNITCWNLKKRRRRYKSMLRLNKKFYIYIRLKWWLITFLCLYILLLIRNLFFLLPYLNKIWLFFVNCSLDFLSPYWIIESSIKIQERK